MPEEWVGLALIIGGILLAIDGVGSILAPFNTHSFWSDLERAFRTIGGISLILLGIYIHKTFNFLYKNVHF